MKFVPRTLLTIALLLAVAVTATAQDDAEPVVYEDIAFPELPYPSRWIEVNGSKIHYLEAGDPAADPILFLHGQPTWSYLYVDVMPHLEDAGRLIAVDNIGFGRSDRPDIDYRFEDHYAYIEGFIEEMELENITLVIHDWGSALGFHYAAQNPDNVKAIAYMEALIPPIMGTGVPLEELPQGLQEFFAPLRTEGVGEYLLMEQNFFVEVGMQASTATELTEAQLNAYRAPFPTPGDRFPLWRFPNEVPFGGEPADNLEMMQNYQAWMGETDTPMLHLYAEPGVINPQASVDWSLETVENITTADIGVGAHFVQHDQPDAIGEAIAVWLTALD